MSYIEQLKNEYKELLDQKAKWDTHKCKIV